MGFFDKLKGSLNNETQNINHHLVDNGPVFNINDYINTTSNLSLDKVNGRVSLKKHSAISMVKTPKIQARCTWSSHTDYDLYAIVLMKNGEERIVSTFGSEKQPTPTPILESGAVRHNGDVGRMNNSTAMETIDIQMTPDILAVVPVAYSAQSNGTGSFRRYKVDLDIDNGAGETVHIDSSNASNNDGIYTVAIGAIVNAPDGTITIVNIEAYSAPNSENRPAFQNGQLFMDRGSRNLYK